MTGFARKWLASRPSAIRWPAGWPPRHRRNQPLHTRLANCSASPSGTRAISPADLFLCIARRSAWTPPCPISVRTPRLSSGSSVASTARPTHPNLDTKQKSHLYRIAQEAVNNAIVHGRARRIEISLAFQAGRGALTIEDNGVGIGTEQEGHRGVGLRTMSYRARLIGASFQAKRRSPRGTVVTCCFSLPGTDPAP